VKQTLPQFSTFALKAFDGFEGLPSEVLSCKGEKIVEMGSGKQLTDEA
jgi:hypothetical protein